MDKQALESKIRYQVACEEKAHRIVEQLLEPGITEAVLADVGLYITPDHYQDITEERAITKLCGYPICSNQITKVLSQKYHISTKTNKVYDITDRKNFCSNECYKASVYYHKQISSSPLWSRKEEAPKPITLLPTELNRGSVGKEVIDKQTELYREAKRLRNEEKKEQRKKSGQEDGETDEEKKEQMKKSGQGDGETDEEKKEQMKKSGQGDGETDQTIENLVVGMEKHHICESKSQDGEKRLEKKSKSGREKHHPRRNTEKHEETSSSEALRIPAKSASSSNSNQSEKVTKLMALLDRRKHLLGKMVQDETVQTPAKLDSAKSSSNRGDDEDSVKASTNRGDDEEDSDEDGDDSCNHSEKERKVEEEVIIPTNRAVICEKTTSEAITGVSDADKRRGKRKKKISTKISYLGMICELMKEWVTPETLSFVSSQGEDEERQAGISTEMEAKIKDLCRRVDQQETALDDIIGEEDTLEEQLPARSPLPDYTVMKKETQDFTQQVQNYFAGGKAIIEKESKAGVPVYLPPVDSHDQLLIRQKIVMDQLNKVIPDLLPPLKLTIQDVFGDMKQLVMTFRLSSKNILFKPAEWTLVGLLLLKILSRKNLQMACAFLNTSAVQYFSVLLNAIKENMENVDSHVTNILQQHGV